ncbi:hypothetical protein NMY22_g14819 [Coprinellus aureogranulatus]|nr:hypothetical protein NMY22_g14819 [Coprinellus aureogranulatus]
MKIAKKLVQDAANALAVKPKGAVTDGYWNGNGSKTITQDGRVRKPDLLSFWDPVPTGKGKAERPTWSTVKHIVEFKRNLTALSRKSRPVKSVKTKSIASCPPAIALNKGKGKRPRNDSDDEEEGIEDEEHDKEDEDSDDHGMHASNSKKARVDECLFDGEVQLACYALEALAATNRYWVPGILIDKWVVTACYFDRHLVVCTENFSFQSHPEKLALILYASRQCSTKTQIGFDPHLRPWSSHSEGKITSSMKAALDRPVKTPVGAFLEYDQSEVEEKADDEDVGEPISLRIVEVIRRPNDLISRGTTVYKVTRRLADGSYSGEHYAFKLSSPLSKRKSEFKIVKILKARIPELAHDHFPRFLYSVVLTSEGLDLPWHKLSLKLDDSNHQERVLRGILGALCVKLWEAGDPEKFKQVFIDCVEGESYFFLTGERRLTLTFQLTILPGNVKGVLNDWDMAKFYDDEDDMRNIAHHRTCSPPFMAIELLLGMTNVYYYRYDLESFFWLLIWAAVHYDLEKGTRDPSVVSSLVPLTLGRKENMSRKLNLLMPGEEAEYLFAEDIKENLKPGFEGIYAEWILPLRQFFMDARAHKSQDAGDKETRGGRLTFKKFMKVLTKKDDGYRTWGIPRFLEGKE